LGTGKNNKRRGNSDTIKCKKNGLGKEVASDGLGYKRTVFC